MPFCVECNKTVYSAGGSDHKRCMLCAKHFDLKKCNKCSVYHHLWCENCCNENCNTGTVLDFFKQSCKNQEYMKLFLTSKIV